MAFADLPKQGAVGLGSHAFRGKIGRVGVEVLGSRTIAVPGATVTGSTLFGIKILAHRGGLGIGRQRVLFSRCPRWDLPLLLWRAFRSYAVHDRADH